MNLKPVDKVLFLDIETVPQYETFEEVPELLKKLFLQRFKKEAAETDDYENLWFLKASLYPEFGKIVCISVGMMYNGKFVTKSFASEDEVALLNDFVGGKLMDKLNDISGGTVFSAYNGNVFDFPFIAKRLIINELFVPKVFFYTDLKPWERNFMVDLKVLWKWDVFDANVSLGLLGYALGLKIHKDEMDGSMVKDVYYKEKDIKKIALYCEQDVDLLYRAYVKIFANFSNS